MTLPKWLIHLILFMLMEGALCLNHFNSGLQNKQAMARIRNRLKKDRVLTYAVVGTSEAITPMAIMIGSIADEISHSTCVQFVQEASPALADMLVRETKGDCSLEFRDIDYTYYVDKCASIGNWVVDKLLILFFGMDERFRYPLYKARGETTLWFMEISNLNQVFECPCKNDITNCELETTCGRSIGKCRATCAICPYNENFE